MLKLIWSISFFPTVYPPSTRKFSASCRRREAINNPTQLQIQWNKMMTSTAGYPWWCNQGLLLLLVTNIYLTDLSPIHQEGTPACFETMSLRSGCMAGCLWCMYNPQDHCKPETSLIYTTSSRTNKTVKSWETERDREIASQTRPESRTMAILWPY